MADAKVDGLATAVKEQGDLIRSMKLNSAPKDQVTEVLHVYMFLYKCSACFTFLYMCT